MALWRLKDCPRCGGDTFIDADVYGWYQQCLQCSYRCNLTAVDINKQKAASSAAE